jgi:hypothetical protein
LLAVRALLLLVLALQLLLFIAAVAICGAAVLQVWLL